MPRISQLLTRKAWKTSRYLPPILSVTRDLPSAISELRWLTEHVFKTSKPNTPPLIQHKRLLKLVKRRGRCEPLQYILGSQPFGKLDIKCRKGVLIPRPESEAYVSHIIDLYREGKLHHLITSNEINWRMHELAKNDGTPLPKYPVRPLKILDACSGSGAIGIALMHGILPIFPYTLINGIDSSPKAIRLARENIERNARKLGWHLKEAKFRCQFHQHDIFDEFPMNQRMYDIIVSNPPYISPQKFLTETERSVRIWEPKMALVPPIPTDMSLIKARSNIQSKKGGHAPEDIFYARLLHLHESTFNKILVMEVGDAAQAIRVLNMALNKPRSRIHMLPFAQFNNFSIWRDNPSGTPSEKEVQWISIGSLRIPINGSGKVRSVVVYRTKNWAPEHKVDFFNKVLTWDAKEGLKRVKHAPRKLTMRQIRKRQKRDEELAKKPRLKIHLGESGEVDERIRRTAGVMGQNGWTMEMHSRVAKRKHMERKKGEKLEEIKRLNAMLGKLEDENGDTEIENSQGMKALRAAIAMVPGQEQKSSRG